MKIAVTLPRDRSRPGRLRLSDEAAVVLDAIPCLGKADGGRALKEGNPSRDPVKPYGDTPTGVYRPAEVMIFEPEHRRMGRHAIPLIGIAGQALAAMTLRTELYIHATPGDDAGRGSDRLIPTYGCLRLRDADMAALAAKIGGRRVEIEIDEETEEA